MSDQQEKDPSGVVVWSGREYQRQREHAGYEERIERVETKIIEGWTGPDVIRYLMREEGLSQTQSYRYLAEVRRRWAAMGRAVHRTKNMQASLAKALLRRDKIFASAINDSEWGKALDAEKDRCKLEGLYPVTEKQATVEHNETTITVVTLDDARGRFGAFAAGIEDAFGPQNSNGHVSKVSNGHANGSAPTTNGKSAHGSNGNGSVHP